MSSGWKAWISVRVTHDFYRSGLSDDLRFVPAPDTARALAARGLLFREREGGFALLGRVETAPTAPHHERAPNAVEPGTGWRFFVFVRASEFFAVTELPGGGPFLFSNGTGATLTSSAAGAEVREAGAFGAVALTSPPSGWPQIGTSGGHDVVEPRVFLLPFSRRTAVWRYHVVLKPGDTTTGLSITYAPPSSGPWPAGITFDPMAAPPEVQASYPGRAIASFESSAPLPFHEGALARTALRRAGKTLVADLPNPRWQPSASPSDVLVELR